MTIVTVANQMVPWWFVPDRNESDEFRAECHSVVEGVAEFIQRVMESLGGREELIARLDAICSGLACDFMDEPALRRYVLGVKEGVEDLLTELSEEELNGLQMIERPKYFENVLEVATVCRALVGIEKVDTETRDRIACELSTELLARNDVRAAISVANNIINEERQMEAFYPVYLFLEEEQPLEAFECASLVCPPIPKDQMYRELALKFMERGKFLIARMFAKRIVEEEKRNLILVVIQKKYSDSIIKM